jgi:hypothetical protein
MLHWWEAIPGHCVTVSIVDHLGTRLRYTRYETVSSAIETTSSHSVRDLKRMTVREHYWTFDDVRLKSSLDHLTILRKETPFALRHRRKEIRSPLYHRNDDD